MTYSENSDSESDPQALVLSKHHGFSQDETQTPFFSTVGSGTSLRDSFLPEDQL